MIGEAAGRELELALAEQTRCTSRYERAVGTTGELSAYASLRAATRRVAEYTGSVAVPGIGLKRFVFAAAADDTAPGEVRHEVTRRLWGWQVDPSVVDTVELLTSETVTNAVTHGEGGDGGTVAVEGGLLHDRFRLQVTNPGPPFDDPADLPPDTATGGRGLFLVDMLSSAWGRVHLAGLTSVWFEVAAY